MEFGGLKTSFPVAPPVAIFADPRMIAAAPLDMTRAGLGDLFGKASAKVDWLASHELYGEYFCAEVERRVTGPLVHAATHVAEVLRDRRGRFRLVRGLVESGIAMAMIGNSRPASGCEHHASHFWDLLAATGRQPTRRTAFRWATRPTSSCASSGTHLAGAYRSCPPRARSSPTVTRRRSWFAGHEAEVTPSWMRSAASSPGTVPHGLNTVVLGSGA